MSSIDGMELLRIIKGNPGCVEDPKAWNFTKLKIAFENIPDDYKKMHPLIKSTPVVLRLWFTENGGNLPVEAAGPPANPGFDPNQQQQQQQFDPNQQQQQQQFDPNQQQQQFDPNQGMQQQQFDPNMGMQQMGQPQQQQFDPNMGMNPGMGGQMGGGMGGQMGNTMGGGMGSTMGGGGFQDFNQTGGFEDPNAMMSIPRAKWTQIRERFNERDLELKQAHLQIQLMQLQIEKLEAENRQLQANANMGRQRTNTSALFEL